MHIKHLVISGGGHKLFMYFGVIKHLIEKEAIHMNNIQSIYGTSAGAIIGTMLALKMDIHTIYDYLVYRPWKNVFSNMNLLDIFAKKGIYGEDIFVKIFEPILHANELSLDITLLEYYKHTGIELYMYSSELIHFEPVELSYKTYPHLKLVTAIYMSAALPIMMMPHFMDGKCYIDGGLLINYPQDRCIFQSAKEEQDSVLGISTKYSEIDETMDDSYSFMDYLFFILKKIIKYLDSFENKIQIKHNIVIEGSTTTYTDIMNVLENVDIRKDLIEFGESCAETFLEKTAQADAEADAETEEKL